VGPIGLDVTNKKKNLAPVRIRVRDLLSRSLVKKYSGTYVMAYVKTCHVLFLVTVLFLCNLHRYPPPLSPGHGFKTVTNRK